MTDYTPTTEQVRNGWIDNGTHEERDGAEFHRWLTAHDAEVSAKALRDYADEMEVEAQHVLDGMPDVFSGLGRERSLHREEAARLCVAARHARDRADWIETRTGRES